MAGCQQPGDPATLADTVKPYGHHVLLCTGRRNWPARIEEEDSAVGAIVRDVLALADEVDPQPKVTALGTPPAGNGVDLLVYPDAVAYRGVDDAAWPRIRDEHLRGGRVVEDLSPERLTGHDVLVCVHGLRDVRCGTCGPFVVKALTAALAERGLGDVRVHTSSHVGGHKYAGNVIVYPGGTWYGYVTPDAVGDLVDAHLVDGATWRTHLRGRAHVTRG